MSGFQPCSLITFCGGGGSLKQASQGDQSENRKIPEQKYKRIKTRRRQKRKKERQKRREERMTQRRNIHKCPLAENSRCGYFGRSKRAHRS